MNKVYTIGRDPSCDIVISDPTDVVSRVHATLKIKGNGKYLLSDQSMNGTYINGIKIEPNEEIPVTRKDVISFAHVRDLDWNQIPQEKSDNLKWIFGIIGLLLAISVIVFFFLPEDEKLENPVEGENIPEVVEEPQSTLPDTIIKEKIIVQPKAAEKPSKKKDKTKEKKDKDREEEKEKQIPKEEPEVVNPLL